MPSAFRTFEQRPRGVKHYLVILAVTLCTFGIISSLAISMITQGVMISSMKIHGQDQVQGRDRSQPITSIHPRFNLPARVQHAHNTETTIEIIPVTESSIAVSSSSTTPPHHPLLDKGPTPLITHGSGAVLSTRSAKDGFTALSSQGSIVFVTVTDTLYMTSSRTFPSTDTPAITEAFTTPTPALPSPSSSTTKMDCGIINHITGYNIPGGCIYPYPSVLCPFISGNVGFRYSASGKCQWPGLSTTTSKLDSTLVPAQTAIITPAAALPSSSSTSKMDCGFINHNTGYNIPGGCVYPEAEDLCSFVSGNVGFRFSASGECQWPGLSTKLDITPVLAHTAITTLAAALPTSLSTSKMDCGIINHNTGYNIPGGCVYPRPEELCSFISGQVGYKDGPFPQTCHWRGLETNTALPTQ